MDNGKAAKAPPIQFGAVFETWDDKRKITYLKELAASSNHALALMQAERDGLLAERTVLQAQVTNAERHLEIQKQINRDALTKQNEDAQAAAARIQELEGRLRQWRQFRDLLKRLLNGHLD